MFQLVLLNPGQLSGESLSVHNPITRVCPSLVPNDYLCESLIGTSDCPLIPLMPIHEKRPRAAHKTNPFYVALSSAFIFLHYHSDPIQFKNILEKVQTLLSKTLEIKELLDWKFRTKRGTVPRRREFVGPMADLSLRTTRNHAEGVYIL
jgi:hypothetical protein